MSKEPEYRLCDDCGVAPGEFHKPGCDVERCSRCGGQAISCGCIYEVNGIDQDTMEEDHPDIYCNGPTPEMYARWQAEWGHKDLPWTGDWPGAAECREFGFWCKWTDRGWERCDASDPEARENLNRLHTEATWDAEAGRWVRRGTT